MLDRLRTDLRTALRGLAATPGLTAAALLTLALAIGINLGMLTVVHRALSGAPDLVKAPDRLFTLAFEHDVRDERVVMTTTSYPTFTTMRDSVGAFAGAAAWSRSTTFALIGTDQVPIDAMPVSGQYFDLLGVAARMGRVIARADDDGGVPPVAVLSDELWGRVLHRDPAVLGRRLRIGAIDYTVVGVMPAGFTGHTPERVDVWLPFAQTMRGEPGWQAQAFRNIASVLVRLGDGESSASAEAQAGAALTSPVLCRPIAGASVAPTERRITIWLTAVSVFVLVIGLANAATLLLVRAVRRRADAAVRIALGATLPRLVAQAGIESLLLGAGAAVLSVVFSGWFESLVRRVLLPRLSDPAALDLRTVGLAAIAGLVAAVVGGTVSASQLRAGRLIGPAARAPRGHRPLLVVQTALSVLLLAGAAMLGRSFWNLASQDFGFRMREVWLVELDEGAGGMADRDAFFRAAAERVRALPGVVSASVKRSLPFSSHHVPPMYVPGRPEPPTADGQLPFLVAATPELLDILGVELVEGRLLTRDDDRGAPVVVVSQSLARAAWPGERAIGRCIQAGFDPSFDPFTAQGPPPAPTSLPCREVVGVVGDLRQRSVVPAGREGRLMHYFVPFSQVPGPPAGIPAGPLISGLIVRTTPGVGAMASAIRRGVAEGRVDLPFVEVTPYSDLRDRQMRPWFVGTALLALFGALALVVASVGLYAAYAHLVHERRREMAIRLAVGAAPRSLVGLILADVSRVTAIGIAAGCLGAVVGGRWIASLLFDTAPSDPLVLGLAGALMALVALGATIVPALTASKSDPNAVLRDL